MTFIRDNIKNAVTVGAAVFVMLGMFATSQVSAKDIGGGHASWYALHSRTASGQMMNPERLTAAHKSLPFGTLVHVTNKKNGRTVTVCINDRGPFIRGRTIDVSRAAARKLDFIRAGAVPVKMKVVGRQKHC